MLYFNGRVNPWRASNVHGYICANSKAEAVRVGKAAFGDFSIRELNEYWSPCWGTAAEAVLGQQTEPGLWLGIGHLPTFFKFAGAYNGR